jgi:polynucleotide 5'-kinase involved in rRNA processing
LKIKSKELIKFFEKLYLLEKNDLESNQDEKNLSELIEQYKNPNTDNLTIIDLLVKLLFDNYYSTLSFDKIEQKFISISTKFKDENKIFQIIEKNFYDENFFLQFGCNSEIYSEKKIYKKKFDEFLEKKKKEIKETKIIILGEENVGKTSLKKLIMNKETSNNEQSTIGIEIDKYEMISYKKGLFNNQIDISFNIYDFGIYIFFNIFINFILFNI